MGHQGLKLFKFKTSSTKFSLKTFFKKPKKIILCYFLLFPYFLIRIPSVYIDFNFLAIYQKVKKSGEQRDKKHVSWCLRAKQGGNRWQYPF